MTEATTALERPSDVLEVIRGIEKEFPVLEWRVDGLRIWPILRMRLFVELHGQLSVRVDDLARRSDRSVWRRAGDMAMGWFGALGGDPAVSRHEGVKPGRVDLVIWSDGLSGVVVDGRWLDVFADPLCAVAQECGLESLCWNWTHEHRLPRLRPTRFVQMGMDVANLRGAACGAIRRPEVALPRYDAFLTRLERDRIAIRKFQTPRLASLAARERALRAHFEGLLRECDPHIVMLNCYYSLEGMALVHACRRLGITAVDVQHGLQGEFHAAYAGWDAVPREGFELLPELFWCWTDAEASVIERWQRQSGAAHRVVNGGNPWLDLWRRGVDPMVAQFDARIATIREASRPRRHILVTLQWGIAEERFLEPLLHAVVALGEAYFWWIRLHPAMRQEMEAVEKRCTAAAPGAVEVRSATELPLHALLRHVDAHVTYYSSVVLDAEACGVASIVTSDLGADYFPDQLCNGMAVRSSLDPGALGRALAGLPPRRPPRETGRSNRARDVLESLIRSRGAHPDRPSGA